MTTPQRALELANFFKISLHEMGLGANGGLVSARKIEELESILRHYAEIMQAEVVGTTCLDDYGDVIAYCPRLGFNVELIIKPKPLP